MTRPQPLRVVDARALEPPEPFVATLDMLDTLQPGETMLLQLYREPFPLYRALELNGFAWKDSRDDQGVVEVLIWQRSG